MSLLVAVLLASLLGSLHCAGMCGPLVAFAVGASPERSWSGRAVLHVAYHGGRLATYAPIGALAGGLGAAFDFGGSRAGVPHAATLLAGGLMIVVGLAGVLRASGVRLQQWPLPETIRNPIVRGQRAALSLRPWRRAWTVGLLTALLPCGWLYSFVPAAAGMGSPLGGALLMIAFWLGTLPVLVSLGVGVQALSAAAARRLPLISALLVIALGVSTIAMRWSAPVEASQASIPAATTVEQIQALGHTTPSCCRPHDK